MSDEFLFFAYCALTSQYFMAICSITHVYVRSMRVAFDCVSSGSIEKEKAMKRLALLTAAAGFLVALTSARPALSDSAALVEENSATTIVLAQAEGKKERKGEERRGEERKFRGRLPNNYGKVGVSDAQRKTIYGIQLGYRKQREALTEQLADLKSKQNDEVEAVLTDDQRKELKSLQDATRKRVEDRKKKNKKAPKSDKAADSKDS